MEIEKVISVCSKKDIEFWRYSSKNILNFIESKTYEVIVPDNEYSMFVEATPASVNVVPESYYSGWRDLAWLKCKLPPALNSRAGWYFQQFLKIESIRKSPDTGLHLIWDADTVPLKKLAFTDNRERIIYRTGLHKPAIHEPYFDSIRVLLGLERRINDSFIAQCFPTRREWVQNMCHQISLIHNEADWWEVLIEHLSKNPSGCGFSEYETMGTWIYEKHREEIILKHGEYFRPGNSLFPLERTPSDEEIVVGDQLEYVAYDDYDHSVYGGLNIGCGNNRMIHTFDNKKFINADILPTLATDMIISLDKPLPFRNETFTQVVAHNVLEHVDNVIESLKELDRVLAPGGVLLIEVPHIGSYNHGKDVTHKRGLTFDSFTFLLHDSNYLYTRGGSPFRYRLIEFNRENWIDGQLSRERMKAIPPVGTYSDWLSAVRDFRIPGTFGFLFQKVQTKG